MITIFLSVFLNKPHRKITLHIAIFKPRFSPDSLHYHYHRSPFILLINASIMVSVRVWIWFSIFKGYPSVSSINLVQTDVLGYIDKQKRHVCSHQSLKYCNNSFHQNVPLRYQRRSQPLDRYLTSANYNSAIIILYLNMCITNRSSESITPA